MCQKDAKFFIELLDNIRADTANRSIENVLKSRFIQNAAANGYDEFKLLAW